MDNENKKNLIGFFVITAPIVGFLTFILFSTIFGPFIIEAFGDSNTKIIAIFIAIIALPIYGKIILSEDKPKKPYSVKREKIRSSLLSILSFALAPFGFADSFRYRGNDMPPVMIGCICLFAGLYFLYNANRD